MYMQLRDVLNDRLIIGDLISVHGLGILPLQTTKDIDCPPLRMLDEALQEGTLKITETGEGGEVPFLVIAQPPVGDETV